MFDSGKGSVSTNPLSTAGQVAQHGTTMFDSGKGSEEPDYVELDEPTHHPNLMDMYLGEVQRTGPPGKCCR